MKTISRISRAGRFAAGSVLALALSAPLLSPALTVRVQPVNGVPQIMVNGTPTIARIFYGGPGAPTTLLVVGEKQMNFTFTPIETTSSAIMYLSFNGTPGTVVLEDLHVVDLTEPHDVVPAISFASSGDYARDWKFSPRRGAAAQVVPGAGLQIVFPGPATTQRDDEYLQDVTPLELKVGHSYRIDLGVKADVAERMSITFGNAAHAARLVAVANDAFYAQIRMAAKSGVNFVTFQISPPWPPPGQPDDTSYIDALCAYILEANPQALLIPRIKIDAPAWWLKAHPDDQMQWQGNVNAKENVSPHPVSIASQLYRKEAAQRLGDLVDHLETVYGDHMAGYHIAAQNTNEWFYNGTWWNAYSGYAPVDLAEWRAWLHAQYPADADLQKAWNDPAATCDTAPVPTLAEHRRPTKDLLDPVDDRMLLDWNNFRQEDMTGALCDLAHLVREKTNGRKLVLSFYGYLFEFAQAPSGAAVSGHYNLRRLLDSPDLDILCSPISYFDRAAGESAPAMSTPESVELAGKLYLMEDDTSTYLNYLDPPGAEARATTLEQTNQLLLRNGAEVALRNLGTWWMDLCQIGFFDDPRMWAMLDNFRPVEEEMLRLAQPFHPEVAAVIDEKNMRQLTAAGRPLGMAIAESRAAFGRMGAPYGQYLNDDVLAGRVPWAKLDVFLSPWRMTQAERTKLLEATQGKVKVWGYAPGYDDGDTVSLAAMKELTGFQVRLAHPQTGVVTPTEAGTKLGLLAPFGSALLHPAFAVNDAGPDEKLATFDDGSTAIALRKTGDGGTSLFVGTPDFTPELLRMAAQIAGVHLYSRSNAVVYANGPYVAIHAVQDGPLAVDFGQPGEIIDALTGKMVGTGPSIDLPIKKGETRVFMLSRGPAP
jgi:hypothetical protein